MDNSITCVHCKDKAYFSFMDKEGKAIFSCRNCQRKTRIKAKKKILVLWGEYQGNCLEGFEFKGSLTKTILEISPDSNDREIQAELGEGYYIANDEVFKLVSIDENLLQRYYQNNDIDEDFEDWKEWTIEDYMIFQDKYYMPKKVGDLAYGITIKENLACVT